MRSSRIADEFHRLIGERGLCNTEMAWQSCFGCCAQGPNVLVQTLAKHSARREFVLATPPLASRGGRAAMYNHVTPGDVTEIVRYHLELGKPVRRLMERAKKRAQSYSETPIQSNIAEKDGDT